MINIEEQIQELLQFQPGLQIKYSDDNQIALTGIIKINAEYNKIQLVDEFLVEILVFKNFPDKIPVIYELGKRINKKLFQHVNPDNSLCLAVDTEIKLFISVSKSLLAWFQKYVVNYFYSVIFFERYNRYPFGERNHGVEGKKEFYRNYLKLKDISRILNVLFYLRKKNIKGHHSCPCGSGKRLRNCHERQIKELLIIKDVDEIYIDILELLPKKKAGIIMGYSVEKINSILLGKEK